MVQAMLCPDRIDCLCCLSEICNSLASKTNELESGQDSLRHGKGDTAEKKKLWGWSMLAGR